MEPGSIASPVVVFLPFEMENIIEVSGISESAFRRWPVHMTPDLAIDVGMFDLGKPCPFLQPDFRCAMYMRRPVDCWTFPLLPTLDDAGRLAWEYGENCPSLSTLNPDFVRSVKDVWADVWRVLPRSWWDLYRAADDWTGWPLPEESAL
ncbi:MAG: hypothetical protein JXD18_03750 [Anaerolineae bacterium]|nr:hypothetical protein [Anaerolineae bacterium]